MLERETTFLLQELIEMWSPTAPACSNEIDTNIFLKERCCSWDNGLILREVGRIFVTSDISADIKRAEIFLTNVLVNENTSDGQKACAYSFLTHPEADWTFTDVTNIAVESYNNDPDNAYTITQIRRTRGEEVV